MAFLVALTSQTPSASARLVGRARDREGGGGGWFCVCVCV